MLTQARVQRPPAARCVTFEGKHEGGIFIFLIALLRNKLDVLYLCISIYLTQLFRGICRSNAGIPISTRMTCNLLHIYVHLQIQISNIMRAISYRGITYHHLVLGRRLEVSISARRYGSASLQYNLFTANRISSTSLP